MLNSQLVEQFAGIKRQGRSGVFTVVGAEHRLRFCIEDGDPVAMDFCADKELIIASTLLQHHKVGPEIYEMLVSGQREGKGSVTELVRRQQVANDDEIAQVTRAMVEETLLTCFSTPHQETQFDEQDSTDTFDFDASAIRLRISTDVLLTTVQSKVAEADRINREVGGGAGVFTLAESESGTVPLSEFEKHVLNFIDGNKSVDDIAVAFRDSTANMARLLHGMAAKGVIQKVTGSTSKVREAVQESARGTLPDRVTVSMPPASSGEMSAPEIGSYRSEAPKRTNIGLFAAAGIALVVVISVVALVMQYRNRQAEMNAAESSLNANLNARLWQNAIDQISDSKSKAGNDLDAVNRVAAFQNKLDEALNTEHAALTALIGASEFTAAHERLNKLPSSDGQIDDLKAQLKAAEAAFAKRSDLVVAQIGKMLDNGQAKDAVARIAATPGHDGAAAAAYLERWRLSTLERAGSASLPLNQRMSLIAQVLGTDPSPRQREQCARIQTEFSKVQSRTAEQLKQLKAQGEQGAFAEVDADWERLRIDDQVRGTPLAAEAAAIRADIDTVSKGLKEQLSNAQTLITSGDDTKAMATLAQVAQQTAERMPAASNVVELRSAAQLLQDMAGFITDRNANEEATALESWVQERQPSPEVLALIRLRVERLHGLEANAQETLDRARAFTRVGEWVQGKQALQELVAKPEWAHTSAHAAATRDLSEAQALESQRQAWLDELDKAIARSDTTASYDIARRLGLKSLPLWIDTQPSGADIIRDGNKIGVTPMKLDIPAGERAGLNFEFRKAGYITRAITGAEAENGWRLVVAIERQPVASLDLALTLTAQPAVLNDTVWLANRQTAVAIALNTKQTNDVRTDRVALDPSNGGGDTLGQPLYSAPAFADKTVYYATREGMAIRITDGKVDRLPLGAGTDLPIALYHSQLIADRRFIVAACMDGSVRANDLGTAASAWTTEPGPTLVTAPKVLSDRVLVARRTGQLIAVHAEDGKPAAQADLGATVITCWPTAEGLAGYSSSHLWHWNGEILALEPLPAEAVIGSDNIFWGIDNHVRIRQEHADAKPTWKDLGRFDGKPSATPVMWNNHAVIPVGKAMSVIGAQGFVLTATSDFLTPVVVGGRLATATATGVVRIYAP